ncbi:MAG: 30S ribosomal protein S4 [Candidatus Latescibacterota bacterium]|nr:30S ribosomal protein S4 [Candidatus Latescibacterota bacterium]
MARYTGANCKLCRREGVKLFLKGERCYLDKCGVERRGYAPGQHGQRPSRKPSEYSFQLREKQKAKRQYGILENQFRGYYKKAARGKGVTGEVLLQMLEARLDNIVYRLGFAPSRKAARQLVRHGHVTVANTRVNVPSFQVAPGEIVQIKEKSRQLPLIHDALKRTGEGRSVSWLSVDKVNLSGTLIDYPKRADIPTAVEEHLIVELYSK